MAERHTIVVSVEDGRISEAMFCECCPDVYRRDERGVVPRGLDRSQLVTERTKTRSGGSRAGGYTRGI